MADEETLAFEEMMMKEIYKNFIECNETILHKPYPMDGELYCNATFDGYTCWDYAKAGTRTFGKCPQFMSHQFGQQSGSKLDLQLGSQSSNGNMRQGTRNKLYLELPYKDCNSDGTWYRHPDTQSPWTNYSPCSHTEKVRRATTVLYVYFSGYSLSVVSLILALFIFTCFRQLKCTRVTIHKHLFVSYIMTAVLWTSYYASTSFNPEVVANNPIWCRILHVLVQYVTLCNYAWMFCEGFYLHTKLVRTFSNENVLLTICYVTGWGIPVIPSVIYSVLRATNPTLDYSCWHKGTYLIWIFSGPVAMLLLINVIFLINILRILCSKVRAMNQQESNPFRQSLRATLILIPLLGIQYFVLPFRPDAGGENEQYIYDMTSACLSSYQGFLVSLLFCFLNGEVLFLMKNHVVLVKRRMSRTETGKSFIYSAVKTADEKSNRKKSIPQTINQVNGLSNNPDTMVNPATEEDQQKCLELKTTDI